MEMQNGTTAKEGNLATSNKLTAAFTFDSEIWLLGVNFKDILATTSVIFKADASPQSPERNTAGWHPDFSL